MNDFFLNDLGIVCLAFWGVLGFLFFWYLYKIKPLNADSCDFQEFNEAETNAKNSLLESLRAKESLDHQKGDDLNSPEQPTDSQVQ